MSDGKPVIRLEERLREAPRVPCPSCGKAVHPDVMNCPHCHAHYAETAGELHEPPRRSFWMSRRLLTVVAAILAAGWILGAVGGLLVEPILHWIDFVP